MTTTAVVPALASQAVFRALMDAFARPGDIKILPAVAAPAPIAPASAALLKALADYETPIWLNCPLASEAAIVDWIRFHTGASIVTEPADAAFALITRPEELPVFADFAQGTEEYPDRSTTLIVQIEGFEGPSITIEGPGIKTHSTLCAKPLPADFVERLRTNYALFPCGVDLVLIAGDRVAALPRSIRIAQGA